MKKFSRTLNVAPSLLEELAFLMKKYALGISTIPDIPAERIDVQANFSPFL